MIPRLRNQADYSVLLWFIITVATITWVIVDDNLVLDDMLTSGWLLGNPLFLALELIGTACIFWACWAQAKAKGHPSYFALFGLLGFFGLIVVALIPDKSKEGGAVVDSTSPST